jgi:AcrR family transcriptional regulator
MSPQWEFVDRAVPHELRERVLAAALDEVVRSGVEQFTVRAMADRHGIDVETVSRYWGSGQRLLLDTLFHRCDEVIVAPDTGSLRADLETLAFAVARYLNTTDGRRLLRAMVLDDRAAKHPDDTRMIYWRRRYATVRAILDQAAVRGELREGVDPLTGVQILLAPINIRALYTEQPIDDAYCLSVADMAWRALVRR